MHISFPLKLLRCMHSTHMLDKTANALHDAIHVTLATTEDASVITVWSMTLQNQAHIHLIVPEFHVLIVHGNADLKRPHILLGHWYPETAVGAATDAG
jgi:hypothetical protein